MPAQGRQLHYPIHEKSEYMMVVSLQQYVFPTQLLCIHTTLKLNSVT